MCELKKAIEEFKNQIPEIEKKYGIEILLAYVRGSHMYGTATEKSDVDITFVYQQPTETILIGDYKEQFTINGDDTVGYEIQRFLDLLEQNNPNILESLDIPEECLIYKDETMDFILKQMVWVSKLTRKTIIGYAVSQIKKARGLNKAMNNPVEKKTILDFCSVFRDGKLIPFNEWYTQYLSKILSENHPKRDWTNWGLVKLKHSKDNYAMYIDDGAMRFRGLIKDDDSTQLRTSEIPEEYAILCSPVLLTFNSDAYSSHCKDYARYTKWKLERNPERYKLNKEIGQNCDFKNLSHMVRLLDMATGIATKGYLEVRSSNIEYLREVREGKYDYDTLMERAEKVIDNIDQLYDDLVMQEKPDNVLKKSFLWTFRMSNLEKGKKWV